ncbi:RNA methyltransferase [Amnibacterium sp.]|uniref:TrmH family RNA methyltransferase n=1 Tax=Amnibacterium sp. TaxID=1872496 RepID=UPI00260338F3|nr:RNA methyltransferase [Amnibacterium sp.]MCU1472817.1 methyltransferase [Amnibacterium sp.]
MIDTPRSAVVRHVAGLKQKRARSETGLALLEGPQVVREVLAHHPELVQELYLTPEAEGRHAALVAAARDAGIEVEIASDAVIAAMADTRTPQGVVAVARQAPVRLRDAVPDGARLVVVLDGVQDPGNAGTIIRAADAAGADAVILTGSSVDPYNPKVVRSTTGSLFHLPVATGAGVAAALDVARGAGLMVLAADMAGEPLPSLGPALAGPTAWLFGNEAQGLSAEARGLADRIVAVPLYGPAESLNLATAAAVCLYASAFAQRA